MRVGLLIVTSPNVFECVLLKKQQSLWRWLWPLITWKWLVLVLFKMQVKNFSSFPPLYMQIGLTKFYTSLLHFIFFNLYIFYWKLTPVQNFVVFCHTSTWINYRYTYIPILLILTPISFPNPPLQVNTEPLFEFPEPYSKFLLAIYFTNGNVSFHVTLSIHLTLSSPLPMSINLFSMSVSLLLPCK